MQENQLDWDAFDYTIFIALLVGVGAAYAFAARNSEKTSYRFAVGIALAAAFFIVWVNGAVGIIGNENNDANLMYVGVLAVAAIGAGIARFKPQGMALAFFVTAFAQALVGVVALVARFGHTDPSWPWDIVFLTGLFTALWLVSAGLFRHAAQNQ